MVKVMVTVMSWLWLFYHTQHSTYIYLKKKKFDPRQQRKDEQRGDFLGKNFLSDPPEPLSVGLKDSSALQG